MGAELTLSSLPFRGVDALQLSAIERGIEQSVRDNIPEATAEDCHWIARKVMARSAEQSDSRKREMRSIFSNWIGLEAKDI